MYNFNTLVKQHSVWRAKDVVRADEVSANGLSTGYSILDELLRDRGWPMGGLVEILCDRYGIGELRLLIPGLAKLVAQSTTWVVWINPPFVPYAPALNANGVNIQNLLLVYPETHKEALWTLEETLRSGSCKAVLGWLNEDELTPKQSRRIQTFAHKSGVWATLFRPHHATHKTSSAELRLRLDPPPINQGDGTLVSVLKRRGGWPVPNLNLQFESRPIIRSLSALETQMRQWLGHLTPVAKPEQN